jgi:hypothetical protein
MASMTMIQAIRSAMDVMLARDDNVVVFGQDVGYFGGVFRCTDGLQAKYGKTRVFDAPISEGGIVGSAIGMAAYGLKPLIDEIASLDGRRKDVRQTRPVTVNVQLSFQSFQELLHGGIIRDGFARIEIGHNLTNGRRSPCPHYLYHGQLCVGDRFLSFAAHWGLRASFGVSDELS